MSSTFLLILALAPPAAAPVDFDTEIIPLLTRYGCNAGACHGAAVGRGGFKLSLYGGDPAADFDAVTQQWEGRRVNLVHPERSLVLRKPTADDIDHGGDQRFVPDTEPAQRLVEWIRQGARRDGTRRLEQLDVSLSRTVVTAVDAEVGVQVVARFTDGTTEDVTRWTVLTPEDPAALRLNESGDRLQVLRRGSHLLVARFLDQVVPVRVTLPLRDEAVTYEDMPRNNFIDDQILERLSSLGLPVSPPVDDAAFLRRSSLALTGRLPSVEQVRAFLGDTSPDRRERLIDELLMSEEFVTYWTFELGKLLRVRSQPQDDQGALAFHRWLREQLEERTPYDVLARELMTAAGDSHVSGPANFYRVTGDARSQAEFVSELFLGVRLRCANCHNHPLDHWTQDDYHGLAAVFARINRGRIVEVSLRGDVIHPRTGVPATPRVPGVRFLSPEGDQRPALADWLVAPDNSYFARAIVNRLWKQLMGRGLVEPVDDLRATNPGTHPELLEALAQDFIDHDCDLRHTLRRVTHSATYQRAAAAVTGNEMDDRYYSRFLAHALEPEVLADAIADVTGVREHFAGQPYGTRAVELFDSRIPSDSLDILGRCSREQSCEGETANSGGIAVKLHLLNGPLINAKVSDPEGHLHALIAAGHSAGNIVEELTLAGLSRRPTEAELRFWSEQLTDDDGRVDVAAAEDYLWSLLTSREFATSH